MQGLTNPPPDSPGQQKYHLGKSTAQCPYNRPLGQYPNEVYSTSEFKGHHADWNYNRIDIQFG